MRSFETTPGWSNEPIGQGLNEEQRVLMPEEAQVALAITEIQADQELKIAGELTSAISERTQLETDTVKEANRWLLQRGYLDRQGFSDPGSNKALQLSLNEEGVQYLKDEIEKART